MIDYAHSVVDEHITLEKKKTLGLSVSLKPSFEILIALIVAGFIYMLGYQNNTIAQVRHDVNVKKNKLSQLNVTMDDLRMQKAKLLNSQTILSGYDKKNLEFASEDKIRITH